MATSSLVTPPEPPAEPAEPAKPAGSTELPATPEGPPPAPSVADGVERGLDRRHVTVDRIVRWAWAGAVALVQLAAILITWSAGAPGWVLALLVVPAAALALALAWSAHRWPEVEHRHASYKVDAQGIEIRRGAFWRKVINVPRSRVQHTDVSQGPLERSFGLGTLAIYTAGTDHAKVDLPGLDHATALAIRDHLLPGHGDDAV